LGVIWAFATLVAKALMNNPKASSVLTMATTRLRRIPQNQRQRTVAAPLILFE